MGQKVLSRAAGVIEGSGTGLPVVWIVQHLEKEFPWEEESRELFAYGDDAEDLLLMNDLSDENIDYLMSAYHA